MAVYQLRTFADLVAAVREEVGIQSSDTTAVNRIKRDLNIVYQELLAEKQWWWLQGNVSVPLPAYVSSGTASVAAGSSTVTLSVAPGTSRAGHCFAVDGYSEIYTIESHTAGSDTLKLASEYTGATVAAGSYKIWSDCIPLPVDLKETIEVRHDHNSRGMDPVGLQDFRRIAAAAPRAEGRPQVYHLTDYVDPTPYSAISGLPAVSTRASAGVVKTIVFASTLPAAISTKVAAGEPVKWAISGAGHFSYNGEVFVSSVSTTSASNDTITYIGSAEHQESATADASMAVRSVNSESDYDRYRQLRVYPSLVSSKVTLHVDYIKEALPLESDSDEPSIPLQDRVILMYGALHRAWARVRNPEEAARNLQLYTSRLMKMQGKLLDNQDTPRMSPAQGYLSAKRTGPRRGLPGVQAPASSGGSGGAVVTGTPNSVAVFGSSGEISGSTTISTTELSYLDGVTSGIQVQLDAKASQTDMTAAEADIVDLQAEDATQNGRLDTVEADVAAAQSDIDAHIADTTAAHAASAVSFTPTGTIAATDAQTAVAEVATDAAAALSAHEADTTSIHGIADTSALATKAGAETLTNKTIDADSNSLSNIANAQIKAAAAIAVNKLAALTTSKALVSDGSGFLSASSVTSTELGQLAGVGSAVKGINDAATYTNKSISGATNTLSAIPLTALSTSGASNGQVIKYDGSNWVPGVGSGEGGINYVSASGGNNNAETNSVTGWTQYDDAAATPVDLTGGSFSGWTASSTNPLRGTYSFLFTPSAAGKGASYTITPDRADIKRGSVQAITLEYEPTTGTLATGDYTLWVYDVANSVLIQPSGYTIPGAASGVACKHTATFQLPTNGTTFRVGIHQAVASPPTLKVDSVSVGPQQTNLGAMISDWTAFTPTGSWVSNATYTGYWKRSGDSMLCRVKIALTGAPTATTLTVNLPSGYSIDTAKLPTAIADETPILGFALARDNATNSYAGEVQYSSTTAVIPTRFSTSGANTSLASISATTPFTWGSGDAVYLDFSVPISGWASSMVLSSSSDEGRVVAMRATKSSAISLTTTPTDISGWTTVFDTHGAFDGTTYTVKVPGKYGVLGQYSITGFTSTALVQVLQSGTAKARHGVIGSSSNGSVPTVYTILDCVAGDTIKLQAYCSSGSGTGDTAPELQQFCVEKLAGNQTIAASESVNCRYTSTAGQTINASSNAVIDFGTKDYDSHGCVTTGASWKFTASEPGKYRVTPHVEVASVASGKMLTMYLRKNGSVFSELDRFSTSAADNHVLKGSDTIRLLAGEYIDIRVDNGDTTNRSLATSSYSVAIAIEYVGNY